MSEDPPPPSEAASSTETASPAHWPHMTGQAVSNFIGFTPTMLRKLEDQGFVERGEDKLFDGGQALLGYIRWLKDDARRNNKTEGAKRKEAAQALKVEIEIAKELMELVDIETIELFFAETYTALCAEFRAVPAGVTRDLKLRSDIEGQINGALARCQAAFDKTVAALQSGRPVLDADAEPES